MLVAKKPLAGLGIGSPNRAIGKLANELWGEGDGGSAARRVGAGQIHATHPGALNACGIAPDLSFEGSDADGILHLHRRTPDAEIYFISNQANRPRELQASFRVSDMAPEIWRADTDAIAPVSYRLTPGAVQMPLSLLAHEACFVVFRRRATSAQWTAPSIRRALLTEIVGPWEVIFGPGLGGPSAPVVFDRLISWPDSSVPGIKYFSGPAVYRRNFELTREQLAPGRRLEIDLGEVRELAAVSVNGARVGTLWKPPYCMDVTEAVRAGVNRLEIEVVNLWPNRLIGDRQPGAVQVTFAPDSRYAASSPLLRSGLLGPVRLEIVERVPGLSR
jgi:hypothetical protein